jgi:hypothetical protein
MFERARHALEGVLSREELLSFSKETFDCEELDESLTFRLSSTDPCIVVVYSSVINLIRNDQNSKLIRMKEFTTVRHVMLIPFPVVSVPLTVAIHSFTHPVGTSLVPRKLLVFLPNEWHDRLKIC